MEDLELSLESKVASLEEMKFSPGDIVVIVVTDLKISSSSSIYLEIEEKYQKKISFLSLPGSMDLFVFFFFFLPLYFVSIAPALRLDNLTRARAPKSDNSLKE